MKKIIPLLLALVLVLSGIGAATAETYEFSYGATVEILKDKNGNTIDLGGAEIIIGDWWSGDPLAPATAAEEATAEYREWIQEAYNFKIKQVAVSGWGDNPDFFTNFVTTGGAENYVLILRPDVLATPMMNGLFYDLATLDCLDFTSDKWNATTKNLLSKGSSVYGMRYENSEPRDGIWFNKRLLEEAGINPDSLYDMQADGTWTWQAFEDLCKKITRDTNNDGVIDVYATACQSGSFLNVAIANNGAAYVKMDENGKYYNATKEDAFLEAANWVVNMSKTYEKPTPEGANWDWTFAAFYNGDVAMTVHQDYFKSTLQTQMKDEYGFVMFPVGPKGDTCKTVYQDFAYVIPANYDAERAWKIAFAFNLYSNPTPGYEDEETWKSSYYQYFTDTRAVDETCTMMRSSEHGVVFLSDMIPGYSLGEQFQWAVYGRGGWMTVADQLEASANVWQAFLDTANGK